MNPYNVTFVHNTYQYKEMNVYHLFWENKNTHVLKFANE
jgi:hypothetical protein